MDYKEVLRTVWQHISGFKENESPRTVGSLRTIIVDSKGTPAVEDGGLKIYKLTTFKGDVVTVSDTGITIDLNEEWNYVSLANTGNKDMYVSFDNIHFFRILTGAVRNLNNVSIYKIYAKVDSGGLTSDSELDYLVAK